MDSAEYGRKRAAGNRWTALLQERDHVFVGSAAGEPAALIDQLLAIPAGDRPALTVLQLPHGGSGRLIAAASPALRFTGLAASQPIAALGARDSGSYLLSTIFQTVDAIRAGRIGVDVALVQVAPPDPAGRFSLGIAVDLALDAARQARVVVAQVNTRLPRTQGDCFLALDEIDALVEAERELPSRPAAEPDDQALGVAAHVIGLVPDEATIEIGVGEIMTGVLRGLRGHRDLALHTGLFTEPMIPLIETGVITNRLGRLPGGVSVANQATGDLTVSRFVHDNAAVAFMPASYTHDPAVLGSQHRLHAINSAIEVDLLGRVNSEFIGGERVGSGGGLLDFVRAARTAPDGRSVIALRSTTKNGARTKIVSRLSSPGCCTVDADLADTVVTEHGSARLADRTAQDRIRAMIAVADPAFRDQLAAESRTLF